MAISRSGLVLWVNASVSCGLVVEPLELSAFKSMFLDYESLLRLHS